MVRNLRHDSISFLFILLFSSDFFIHNLVISLLLYLINLQSINDKNSPQGRYDKLFCIYFFVKKRVVKNKYEPTAISALFYYFLHRASFFPAENTME